MPTDTPEPCANATCQPCRSPRSCPVTTAATRFSCRSCPSTAPPVRVPRMDRAPGTVALLDAIVAHAPVGLGFWDHELRLRHANAALGLMAQAEGTDPTGSAPPDLLGALAD